MEFLLKYCRRCFLRKKSELILLFFMVGKLRQTIVQMDEEERKKVLSPERALKKSLNRTPALLTRHIPRLFLGYVPSFS